MWGGAGRMQVKVICSSPEIPKTLELDIAGMEIGERIFLRDIKVPGIAPHAHAGAQAFSSCIHRFPFISSSLPRLTETEFTFLTPPYT
jgi:hypothetical protein